MIKNIGDAIINTDIRSRIRTERAQLEVPRMRSENSKIKYRYREENCSPEKSFRYCVEKDRNRNKRIAPKQLLVIARQRINVVSGLLFLPSTLVRARCLFRNLSLNIASDRREIVAAGEVTGPLKYCKHWENRDARGNGRGRSYVSTIPIRILPKNIESFNAYKLREALRRSLNNR